MCMCALFNISNDQWQSRIEEVGKLYFPSSFSLPPFVSLLIPLPLPSPPLRSRPLNTAWNLGKVVRYPSGVWGRAPEEIKFGAFWSLAIWWHQFLLILMRVTDHSVRIFLTVFMCCCAFAVKQFKWRNYTDWKQEVGNAVPPHSPLLWPNS